MWNEVIKVTTLSIYTPPIYFTLNFFWHFIIYAPLAPSLIWHANLFQFSTPLLLLLLIYLIRYFIPFRNWILLSSFVYLRVKSNCKLEFVIEGNKFQASLYGDTHTRTYTQDINFITIHKNMFWCSRESSSKFHHWLSE